MRECPHKATTRLDHAGKAVLPIGHRVLIRQCRQGCDIPGYVKVWCEGCDRYLAVKERVLEEAIESIIKSHLKL